ncbi:MAG: ABC transporter substrate-binding protein, partial [Sarcina sp.]
VDVEIHNKLKEEGKLYTCETSWCNDVSALDKGDDGTWYSTTKEPIVLFYNSKYMTANIAPKSWLDLADKTYKDKVIMEQTNEQYIKNMLSTIMYQFEKNNKDSEGLIFLQGLKNNIYKLENSSEELFNDIQNKETPIGISKLSDFIKAKNNNIQLVEVNSSEGNIFETESVSILQNAQHLNIAKLFVEFVAGPRIQLNLATKFNLIPTNPEALKYSPEWMQKLLDKSMPIDYKIINENNNRWIEEFNKFEKDQSTLINLNKNIK